MFGEKILDYWDDIMKDLGDIIAIPSVAQPQDGPYPFGKDAATAVDKAIEIAERYGIKTKNSDYYAALIIPETFTQEMLGFIDGEVDHPTIYYYENEKKSNNCRN